MEYIFFMWHFVEEFILQIFIDYLKFSIICNKINSYFAFLKKLSYNIQVIKILFHFCCLMHLLFVDYFME